jgi:lysophospholipase L1-like esterase
MIGRMARVSSRSWFWFLPASIGALATLLFAAGFWLALRGSIGTPLGAPPPPPQARAVSSTPTGSRLLLVLGDSLARGTGDEMGRGFAAEVLDALRKQGPVEIANLAVNGAESGEVRELLQASNVQSLASRASWILLSVGGNDLSHAVPQRSAAPASPVENLSRARDRYASNLRAILAALRDSNPSAPIRVLGLYDPFEGAGAQGRIGASVILGWNGVVQETALAFPGVLVVPTFDLFERREDRLALDHFHPNRAGYALIAARLLQTLS